MTPRFSTSSFVAGLMIGILLTGSWFLGDAARLAPFAPAPPAETAEEPSLPESGAVSVSDQPAGDEVIVESVTVPSPGAWVAVRETSGRDLGNVLGAARVIGPHSLVVVQLLRATEPGRSYAVQLYRDDNGGAFDPSRNSVYVDFDTGARVVAYFMTVL